jgi:hypothetical protein
LIALIKNSQTSSNVNSVVSCFEHKKVTLKKVTFFIGQLAKTRTNMAKSLAANSKKAQGGFS